MKMIPKHYQHMKSKIEPLVEKVEKHIEYLKTDERVKDINKRLRWDLFYAAGLTTFTCDELYKYLDDTHIDTALRQIMKDLNIKEVN